MVSRASSLCGMDTKINEDGIRNILSQFTDYKKSSVWAMNSLAFCYNELILDDSEINIEPKLNITRAEVAQMLYNMLGCAEMI